MTSKRGDIVAVVLILCLMFSLPGRADEATATLPEPRGQSVDTDDSTLHQINELTDQIVMQEIELQKLNTLFRIESVHQPKLRPWRQFLYSETNSNLTEAGLIGRMALSYPYMTENSGRPNQSAVQRCAAVSMVGQFFAATGESFELLTNLRNGLKAQEKGLDAKTYRKKVAAKTEELDILIDKRDQLINSARLNETDLKIVDAETLLLKDVRDLALVQYGQYHSSAKKLRFFQNAAYLISISRNLVGATSNMLNIEASRRGDTNISGHASLLNLIAGALVVATPVFGRVSGNLAGLVDRRIVSKDYAHAQARETATFVRDRLRFTEALDGLQASTALVQEQVKRSRIYSRQEALLVAQEANIKRARKQGKSTAIENVVTGTVVGSSRMAAGILGMIGAWKYSDAPWMSSRYTAAAATAYGAGTAFNSLETARVRFQEEMRNRQYERKGLLPQQILQQRLATLDAMEQSLKNEKMASVKSNSLIK